jgi:hypothetical protein
MGRGMVEQSVLGAVSRVVARSAKVRLVVALGWVGLGWRVSSAPAGAEGVGRVTTGSLRSPSLQPKGPVEAGEKDGRRWGR